MKTPFISLVMITKDCEDSLDLSLKSAKDLAQEIIIVDSYSKDKTIEIAKKYGSKIYFHKYLGEGQQRKIALSKARGEWVLVLDSDEVITQGLKREIQVRLPNEKDCEGFLIPIQSHLMKKKLKYGGENYKKLCLFRRNSKNIILKDALVHADMINKKAKVLHLKNKINHYSYRSFSQMYSKFTDYALREARQKQAEGEKTSLRKIVLYPLHMFWARFIEDRGYMDGFFRIPLDVGFAYMEFLTYFSMLFIKNKK